MSGAVRVSLFLLFSLNTLSLAEPTSNTHQSQRSSTSTTQDDQDPQRQRIINFTRAIDYLYQLDADQEISFDAEMPALGIRFSDEPRRLGPQVAKITAGTLRQNLMNLNLGQMAFFDSKALVDGIENGIRPRVLFRPRLPIRSNNIRHAFEIASKIGFLDLDQRYAVSKFILAPSRFDRRDLRDGLAYTAFEARVRQFNDDPWQAQAQKTLMSPTPETVTGTEFQDKFRSLRLKELLALPSSDLFDISEQLPE